MLICFKHNSVRWCVLNVADILCKEDDNDV